MPTKIAREVKAEKNRLFIYLKERIGLAHFRIVLWRVFEHLSENVFREITGECMGNTTLVKLKRFKEELDNYSKEINTSFRKRKVVEIDDSVEPFGNKNVHSAIKYHLMYLSLDEIDFILNEDGIAVAIVVFGQPAKVVPLDFNHKALLDQKGYAYCDNDNIGHFVYPKLERIEHSTNMHVKSIPREKIKQELLFNYKTSFSVKRLPVENRCQDYEEKRLNRLFPTWFKKDTKISKFVKEVDCDFLYTKKELSELITPMKIKPIELMCYKSSNGSSMYGHIIQKVETEDGLYYAVFPQLVDVIKHYQCQQ